MGEGPVKRKASGGEGGNTSYWPKKGKKEKKASDGEPKKEKKSSRKREGDDVQSDASAAIGIAKKKSTSKSSGKKPTSKDEHAEGGAGAGAAKPDGEYVNKVPQNHKEQKELAVKRKKERNPHFDMVQEVRGRAQNNTTCLHVRTRTHTHSFASCAHTLAVLQRVCVAGSCTHFLCEPV
jgi:hypothetical protein